MLGPLYAGVYLSEHNWGIPHTLPSMGSAAKDAPPLNSIGAFDVDAWIERYLGDGSENIAVPEDARERLSSFSE